MATISVKVFSVDIAVVILSIDGVVIGYFLDSPKTQAFIEPYSGMVPGNDVQIECTTFGIVVYNLVDAFFDQGGRQSVVSIVLDRAERHNVTDSFVFDTVGQEQTTGYIIEFGGRKQSRYQTSDYLVVLVDDYVGVQIFSGVTHFALDQVIVEFDLVGNGEPGFVQFLDPLSIFGQYSSIL